jgi:hypothetical protein
MEKIPRSKIQKILERWTKSGRALVIARYPILDEVYLTSPRCHGMRKWRIGCARPGFRLTAVLSCFLFLGRFPLRLRSSIRAGSPPRPSLIDALKDALGRNNRIVDRGLIGRRSRLGRYLRQFARCQNGGGYEQYALAPFVHPSMIYPSPYLRLWPQDFFHSVLSPHVPIFPIRDSRREHSTTRFVEFPG